MFQCLGQVDQRGFQVVQGTFGAHRARGLGLEVKTAGGIVHAEHQRVAEDVVGTDQGYARHQHEVALGIGMPVIEQAVEQRRRAAATLGQGQRRLLMGEQGAELVMGVTQRIRDILPGQVQAQRQGVDEHAQGAIGALARLQTAEQHGAEHPVITARHAAEHLGPGQVEQAGGADAQTTGLGTQAQVEVVTQCTLRFFGIRPIGLARLHAEGKGGLIQIAQLRTKKRLMGSLARR